MYRQILATWLSICACCLSGTHGTAVYYVNMRGCSIHNVSASAHKPTDLVQDTKSFSLWCQQMTPEFLNKAFSTKANTRHNP